jgi:hypothetical protein
MAYLNNYKSVTVDAILTLKGRELLSSREEMHFNITQFAVRR